MAKIVIQKNTGEEVKSITISSTFRDPAHSLLGLATVLQDLLKTLQDVLDTEDTNDKKTSP